MSITHWLINESSVQPQPDDLKWSGIFPSSYTLPGGDGVKQVYAWAKDSAGNVSLLNTSSHFTLTLDTTPPVVTAFTLTSQAVTLNQTITFNISATDTGTGVTGWLINESVTPPSPLASGWSSVKPSSYNLSSGGGEKTVYAWAKDGAGNVSALAATSHFEVTYYPPSGTMVLKKEASEQVLQNNSTYNFGNLRPPNPSTGLAFTINNTSQNDLEIISGDLEGSYYFYFQEGLPAKAFPLNHGDQVHLRINFSPKESGSFTSVMKILSSDPATPVFTLYLTGSCS